MKPIESTAYNEYFEAADANSIFELSPAEASKHWTKAIDLHARSYFELPNDNWLVASNTTVIGRWIEAYNTGNLDFVATILNRYLNWKNHDLVRYYISKSIVLETQWPFFLKHWDGFLAADDDCPILLKVGEEPQKAIVFTPLGDIQAISHQP